MKSKLTTLKNKTAYVVDCLNDIEEFIKELELDEALNTTKERLEKFDPTKMAGSTVNELDGYEDIECKPYRITITVAVVINILTIMFFVYLHYA